MPAKSRAQRGLMGMALALKRGDVTIEDIPRGVRKRITQITKDMTEEQLADFTRTPEERLPKKKVGTPSRMRKARAS
ncbi:MAG: DUF3008 domain-containing protein [Candidatus Thorarchaeota archaeon]|nr:MAG: DUF3008 domain-containing protein [Candidatus Thorarchaeota archaeon]